MPVLQTRQLYLLIVIDSNSFHARAHMLLLNGGILVRMALAIVIWRDFSAIGEIIGKIFVVIVDNSTDHLT